MATGASTAFGLARYTVGLRRYARQRLTIAEAEALIRRGIQQRDESFLAMIQRSILHQRGSPYRALLKAAGCELGDLRRMVAADGVEGVLEELYRAGVYVTYEELKGRAPLRRGSQSFSFHSSDFDNPLVRGDYHNTSGGSSGRPTRIKIDLDLQAQMAPHWAVWFDIHGVLREPLVFVHPIYPAAMGHHLMALRFGNRAVKWFATGSGDHWVYELATAYLHGVTRWIAGLVPPDRDAGPMRVAAYLARLAATGRKPGVNVAPSMAARIALAAGEAGESLRGVTFLLGAEPLTQARKESIESSGARATVTYGFSEGGNVGNQCDRAAFADDIHISLDAFAAIQRRDGLDPTDTCKPLLLTTFRSASPQVLLNAEIGDTAVLETRACGCRFEQLGYSRHLHTVRSFRKLTGDGVTFHDSDIIQALDAVARRFGGGPADYQIVEEQSLAGIPEYRLLVSPRLGPLEDRALVHQVLFELGRIKPIYRFMVKQWAELGLLQIRREIPKANIRGKVLPYRTLQES